MAQGYKRVKYYSESVIQCLFANHVNLNILCILFLHVGYIRFSSNNFTLVMEPGCLITNTQNKITNNIQSFLITISMTKHATHPFTLSLIRPIYISIGNSLKRELWIMPRTTLGQQYMCLLSPAGFQKQLQNTVSIYNF